MYYHYKSWSIFTRCIYFSHCLVLHYQAISVGLSMNTLNMEIWSLVVKCATLRAPFQSRGAQKCLVPLATVSGGKWDSFLTLHPKTGMFPWEGLLSSQRIPPTENPSFLTKVLKDSVSACRLCILQAVSWNSVLRPSTSSSSWVRTAAVVSACCWWEKATVITTHTSYGLASLHTKLTVMFSQFV